MKTETDVKAMIEQKASENVRNMMSHYVNDGWLQALKWVLECNNGKVKDGGRNEK